MVRKASPKYIHSQWLHLHSYTEYNSYAWSSSCSSHTNCLKYMGQALPYASSTSTIMDIDIYIYIYICVIVMVLGRASSKRC